MRTSLTRREWLVCAPSAALVGSGALLANAHAATNAQDESPASAGGVHPEYPTSDPADVRAVVGAAHLNIDRVRELVEASPALAKAAWDWGFGDWESALGAASHMGRRDIADLLIEHGARPNLFTLAMFGKLDAVKATIEAMPDVQRIPGPHGITLLQHARHGKEPAREVVEYLESMGDADLTATSLEMSDDQKSRYVGQYKFADAPNDAFEVLLNRRGLLAIRRGDRFPRVLNRVEDHGFAPGGAPAVRIRFKVEVDKVVSLTVHDPTPIVTAIRAH